MGKKDHKQISTAPAANAAKDKSSECPTQPCNGTSLGSPHAEATMATAAGTAPVAVQSHGTKTATGTPERSQTADLNAQTELQGADAEHESGSTENADCTYGDAGDAQGQRRREAARRKRERQRSRKKSAAAAKDGDNHKDEATADTEGANAETKLLAAQLGALVLEEERVDAGIP
eukprot:6174385-Pleurochrysis_carterae.AAC.1